MKYGRVAGVVLALASWVVAVPASGTAAARPDVAPGAPSVQTVEAEFVSMMIPHHHQALVMSEMVAGHSDDGSVQALAGRIDAEQGLEIMIMQGWQRRNGHPVTDPVSAYEDLLTVPEMLEQMGMATPEELDTLSGLEGTAFDVLFLELMIRHHEGAVDMAVGVISTSTDYYIQNMATEMMVSQQAQIAHMEDLLADMT